jgi:hypothetical protein
MTKNQHSTFQADSVDSFLKIVLDQLKTAFIFRGQAKEFDESGQEWKLLPAIFRIPRKRGPISLVPFEIYEKSLFEVKGDVVSE